MVTRAITGFEPAGDDVQQHAGRARAGIGEIDVRIGVIDCQAVDLAQHAVGQDAVQIERDHDRHGGSRHLSDAFQQKAFGIEFAVRTHGAVQGHEHGIDVVDPSGHGIQ